MKPQKVVNVERSEERKVREAVKRPPSPLKLQYFTFSPRNSPANSVFSSALSEIRGICSKAADWERVIQKYPKTSVHEFYAEVQRLGPRNWYLEYVSVTFPKRQ
eukprot:TRINITY_DN25350_c0_g1_i1.p2 TRINITY_DN25350_c0_g1~~TRINITY_DN25350_c0_g1_i1.p2  ORF type:complete len:104 (-),score=18.43 TRINITY_DN25350_c0_g1_i1:338-649(-)